MIAQILVADDNADLLLTLETYLAQRHHRVLTAKDGFELSRLAAEHQPHLIITDIQMPGAYGSSVYQMLQKEPKTSKIPVIFISAYSRDTLKAILPDDPKTRFLQKPLALDKLEALVQELLPLGGYIP